MPTANTEHSYGSVARTLHWLTALLIFTLIPLGIIANGLPYYTSEELARKAWLFSMHKTLGVTMFFVALARIGWALRGPKPAPLHPERKAEHWLAETVHWLLYGSLLIVPLSGWIHHAATTGFAPIWWPFGQSLPLVPKDDGVAALFAGLHIVFERVLALSILLHVAGALKHHFIDRDVTLRRMVSGAHADEAPTPHTGRASIPVLSALIAWAGAVGIGAAMGVYAPHGTAPQAAALDAVASDWQVQSGTVEIETIQFGSPVTGSFADWTAQISFDPDVVQGPAGEVTATMAIGSLTLGSVTDQALGPDFFDAGSFPTAVYSGEIVTIPDGYGTNGTLTLKGIDVPVSFGMDLTVDGDQATMRGATTLNRLDFGIGQNMPDEANVGFAVEVRIELTASRVGAAAE